MDNVRYIITIKNKTLTHNNNKHIHSKISNKMKFELKTILDYQIF